MLKIGKGVLPVAPYGLRFEGVISELDKELLKFENAEWCPSDQIKFEGVVKGKTAVRHSEAKICLAMPKLDQDGFFVVGPTKYVICMVGKRDPWHPVGNSWYFLSRGQVLVRILAECLAKAVAPFYFQEDLNDVQLNGTFQSTLIAHPFIRQVPEGKEAAFRNTVLMDFGDRTLHPNEYEFDPELVGCLDPASTSAGERINQVYQLCANAKIVDGKIVKGTSDICAYVENFTIAPQYSPRRRYLARAAGLNSLTLMNPEGDIFGRETDVDTKVFRTAILDLGVYTFEDAIAVRSDINFDAIKMTKTSLWSRQPLNILMKAGDLVRPDSIIAESVEPENEFEKDLPSKLIAPHFPFPTSIEKIQVMKGMMLGTPMYRTVVTFKSYLEIMEGDKVTNLAGTKGVCVMLDDMPVDEEGNPIDIAVSAFGIAKRGALQAFYEMMLRKGLKDGRKDFIGAPLKKLALQSDLSKTTLKWRGREYSAIVGDLAWMRLNKLSAEIACGVGIDRPTRPDGLPIDKASLAGQMIDISKGTVLFNSGFDHVLGNALASKAGVNRLKELINAIEDPEINLPIVEPSKEAVAI